MYKSDWKFPKVAAIFDECKKDIRSWYKSDEFFKSLIDQYYYIEYNEIKNECSKKNDQFADTFPAQKVFMILFYICLVPYINVKNIKEEIKNTLNSNIDLLNMIASYMIFVHLFNTFCGCRMEGSWNKSISNSYVYINDIMNTENGIAESEKKLTEFEEEWMLSHMKELDLSGYALTKYSYRLKINFLRTLMKDAVNHVKLTDNGQINDVVNYMNLFGVGCIDNEIICNFAILSHFLRVQVNTLKKICRDCGITKTKISINKIKGLADVSNWVYLKDKQKFQFYAKKFIIKKTYSLFNKIVFEIQKDPAFELLTITENAGSDLELLKIINEIRKKYEESDYSTDVESNDPQ